MAVLHLSLMIILAVVAEGHRSPFTAFHPDQVARIHGENPARGYHGIHPVHERIQPGPNRIQPAYRRHQASPGVYQRTTSNFQQPSFFSGRNSQLFQSTSGNIVEQTRAQVDSAKAILTSLADNKRAAESIAQYIEDTVCVESLEDAIKDIEASAKLVEENGPEILYLVNIVDSLKNVKDITKLTKASSKMLRILDDLIPNLTAESSTSCNASPLERIESFKGLSKLIEDVLNNNYIQISYRARQQLVKGSKIITEVASFLAKLNKSLATFDTFCSSEKDNDSIVYNTIGDILEDMAVLFEALEGAEKAKEIRKSGEFLKTIVDTFSDLDLDSSLNCGSSGALSALAQNLDDIAGIIKEVGTETLSKELGIDLDLLNSL